MTFTRFFKEAAQSYANKVENNWLLEIKDYKIKILERGYRLWQLQNSSKKLQKATQIKKASTDYKLSKN